MNTSNHVAKRTMASRQRLQCLWKISSINRLLFRTYGYVHVPKEVPPHLLGPGCVWRKCYEVYPCSEVENVLSKYQFLTKTAIFDSLPPVYDEFVNPDSTLVSELALRAVEFILDRSRHNTSQMRQTDVMDGFLQSVLTPIWQLGTRYPHIITSHFARFPRIESYWRRNGINYVCFPKPLSILFSSSPLQLFSDPEPSSIDKASYPSAIYEPTHIRLFKRSFDTIDVSGGCHRQGPFPFSHTLFLFNRTKNMPEQTHAHALMSMFAQLSAQTVQNGFKLDQDLVYPLSAQAILTDGKKFMFACYQLNTLNFKEDDKSEEKRNLMWLGPSLELYDHVSLENEVVGLNETVMKLLAQFLLNKPLRKRPPHSGFMLDTLKKIELEKRRKLKRQL